MLLGLIPGVLANRSVHVSVVSFRISRSAGKDIGRDSLLKPVAAIE